MSDIYGKGPRGKATRLHSQIVRARGGCEAAGFDDRVCSGRVECAHIISRRYASTRTDLENAFCLCSAHHHRFTEFGVEWHDFIESTIGRVKYDALYHKAQAIKKVDWPEEVARLDAIWKAMA